MSEPTEESGQGSESAEERPAGVNLPLVIGLMLVVTVLAAGLALAIVLPFYRKAH